MRYSETVKAEIIEPVERARSNRAFVEQVIARVGSASLAPALLFVGGRDRVSLALRRGQAHLRFDARASLWSHVAILTGGVDAPDTAHGLEVSLWPQDPLQQGPERNGVTAFALRRYLDTTRYPNLAVVTVAFARGAAGRAGLEDALRHPNRDRQRFGLWDSLAAWARYAYAADRMPSPLLEAVAMPSAGLCEYAFEAAGVDLTPGATGPGTCPELIWSTVCRWHESIAAQAELIAYAIIRDEHCTPLPALPLTIELDGLAAQLAPRALRARRAGKPK